MNDQTHGSDRLLRLAFVAIVAAICYALFCWAADDEAAYRAAETPCQPIAGPDYRAPCQLCGRRIVWVPMPCECVWPPVPMDNQNWSAWRAVTNGLAAMHAQTNGMALASSQTNYPPQPGVRQ